MIGNKPSIYNAQSVYNQGGSGGGGGGGGYIPDYLQPVAYIDTSAASGKICMVMPWQKTLDSAMDFQAVVSKVTKSTAGHFFVAGQVANENISNGNLDAYINTNYAWCFFGNIQLDVSVSGFNLMDEIKYKLTGSQKKFTCSDSGGAHTQTSTSSSSYNYPKWGIIGIFGNPKQSDPYTFYGRFHYAWIKKGDERLLCVIPCRHKVTGEPYVMDIVTGVVGKNWTNKFDMSDVSFGPDIDESVIESYFT